MANHKDDIILILVVGSLGLSPDFLITDKSEQQQAKTVTKKRGGGKGKGKGLLCFLVRPLRLGGGSKCAVEAGAGGPVVGIKTEARRAGVEAPVQEGIRGVLGAEVTTGAKEGQWGGLLLNPGLDFLPREREREKEKDEAIPGLIDIENVLPEVNVGDHAKCQQGENGDSNEVLELGIQISHTVPLPL